MWSCILRGVRRMTAAIWNSRCIIRGAERTAGRYHRYVRKLTGRGGQHVPLAVCGWSGILAAADTPVRGVSGYYIPACFPRALPSGRFFSISCASKKSR